MNPPSGRNAGICAGVASTCRRTPEPSAFAAQSCAMRPEGNAADDAGAWMAAE